MGMAMSMGVRVIRVHMAVLLRSLPTMGMRMRAFMQVSMPLCRVLVRVRRAAGRFPLTLDWAGNALGMRLLHVQRPTRRMRLIVIARVLMGSKVLPVIVLRVIMSMIVHAFVRMRVPLCRRPVQMRMPCRVVGVLLLAVYRHIHMRAPDAAFLRRRRRNFYARNPKGIDLL